jgi:hypothetical protein
MKYSFRPNTHIITNNNPETRSFSNVKKIYHDECIRNTNILGSYSKIHQSRIYENKARRQTCNIVALKCNQVLKRNDALIQMNKPFLFYLKS